MKGIDLTITTIIVVILGLIVFLAVAYTISTSSGQVNTLQAQGALRQCCGDRSIYKCGSQAAGWTSITCKVSWRDTPINICDLAKLAGVSCDSKSNLDGFCFC